LEQGAWLTTPATAGYVFLDDANLWDEVSKFIGNSLVQSLLGIKHVPEDPSLN
jgi:hypothetical protein